MAGSKRRHTDTDNSDSKPSWDGNSITMRKWLNDIYLHLEEVDRDFETLVTSGYVLSKNITVVPTVHHAKALSDNNVLEFSFARPIDYDEIFDLQDGDDEPLDAALKDMYSVSPNLVRSVDRAMCKEILVTMVGSVNQKKYKQMCEGSGLKLLLILDVEADEVGPAADATLFLVHTF